MILVLCFTVLLATTSSQISAFRLFDANVDNKQYNETVHCLVQNLQSSIRFLSIYQESQSETNNDSDTNTNLPLALRTVENCLIVDYCSFDCLRSKLAMQVVVSEVLKNWYAKLADKLQVCSSLTDHLQGLISLLDRFSGRTFSATVLHNDSLSQISTELEQRLAIRTFSPSKVAQEVRLAIELMRHMETTLSETNYFIDWSFSNLHKSFDLLTDLLANLMPSW